MQLQINTISDLLDRSFKEDFGTKGDITSHATIDSHKTVSFAINARQPLILCGSQIAEYYFDKYSSIDYQIHFDDSDSISESTSIITGHGFAREVLLLERIILNYLQHLSAIATTTNQFVKLAQGTKARICDTRKTTPTLRSLEKYAVTCGGGFNHRLTLDSSILIKDNHIAICGSIKEALERAKLAAPHYTKIEIECDTLAQVEEAVRYGADIIMLDNMSVEEIRESVEIIGNNAVIECSGNISLDTVEEIAGIGVDIISVGRITHSAKSVDIGLDIV